MITRENYKTVINMIDDKDYDRLKKTDKEYIVLSLHTFNVGSYVSIKLTDDFNRYKNVSNNGDVILEAGQVLDDIENN